MHVVMDAELPLGEAHRRADEIEQAVAAHFPGADVTVHTEPPDAVDR
jgi:ferrous-iron efflux pump FieF